jgi:hypothetical protein
VKVQVVVEVPDFRDMLDDAHLGAIHTSVAKTIASELGKPFPIIDWREDVGGDQPAAVLIAALVERRSANANPNAAPALDLVWRAQRSGKTFEMPGIKPQELYKANLGDWPIDDANHRFREDLRNAALAWINSQNNQIDLKEKFLKHVVIANKVVATSSKFVVVPLPFQGVKIHKDAVLLVTYQDTVGGETQHKEFTLTGLVPRLSDPLTGNTQTHLDRCDEGGKNVPEAQGWATCVAPLSSNPAKLVSVYADSYKYDPHPDVDGGIIVTE